jgi:hypothetical protein
MKGTYYRQLSCPPNRSRASVRVGQPPCGSLRGINSATTEVPFYLPSTVSDTKTSPRQVYRKLTSPISKRNRDQVAWGQASADGTRTEPRPRECSSRTVGERVPATGAYLCTVRLVDSETRGGDDPMSCARCDGLTVPELIREGMVVIPAWRCVLCGDVVDAMILRNRAFNPLPTRDRSRTNTFTPVSLEHGGSSSLLHATGADWIDR